MNWEVVSAIGGLVSAIVAVISLFQINPMRRSRLSRPVGLDSRERFYAYVLACAGWFLCILCGFWIFEPYGSYVDEGERRQVFGIALSFPAIALFVYGYKLLTGDNET